MIPETQVAFTPWRPWRTRSKPIISPSCGGVYLVAHCHSGKPPEIPTPDNLPVEVVYIGEAKDLNSRPLTGPHSKIQARYPQLFGPKRDSLFVTYAPLYETGCKDYDVRRVFSSYVEAMLVWRYTERHGHPPALHYKEREEKPKWLDAVVRKLQMPRK